MSSLVFSLAKNEIEYTNIKPYVDFVFSKSLYGSSCLLLENLNLISAFSHYSNEQNYDFFCYIDPKCKILDGYKKFINDQKSYFNYYNNKIYFLKYKREIYYLFNIFEDNLVEDNFFDFLNNYFFCFNHNINFYLDAKLVFPRNKLLYNVFHEKFKNKKRQG